MQVLCVIAATVFCLIFDAVNEYPANPIQDFIDPAHRAETLKSRSVDLDADGTTEFIAITAERTIADHPIRGEIVLLKECDGNLTQVWLAGHLNPWKLEVGDVDGDGLIEFAVGVWKRSPLDPVMAKRVFFYSWDGDLVRPKWLGSRLSRRFDDFILFDINTDGWAELIALEIADGGKHRIAIYRWLDFGFEWLACSDEIDGIIGLMTSEGTALAESNSCLYKINLLTDRVELTPVK